MVDLEYGDSLAAAQAIRTGIEPGSEENELLDAIRERRAHAVVDEASARHPGAEGPGPATIDEAAHRTEEARDLRERDHQLERGAQEGSSVGICEEPRTARSGVFQGSKESHRFGGAARCVLPHDVALAGRRSVVCRRQPALFRITAEVVPCRSRTTI